MVVTKVLGASLNYRMQPRRRRALKSGPVQTPKPLLGIRGRASVTRFIHGCKSCLGSMVLAQIAPFIVSLAVALALLIAVLALVVVARWRSWRGL